MQLLVKNITITVFFYSKCKFVGSNDHFLRENLTEGLLYLQYDIRYTIKASLQKIRRFSIHYSTLFYIIQQQKASHLD